MTEPKTRLPELLRAHQAELLAQWIGRQLEAPTLRKDLLSEGDLKRQSTEFLELLAEAARQDPSLEVRGTSFRPVRDMLTDLSRERARHGFSATETATFVFSFKQPLFALVYRELPGDAAAQQRETWLATILLDSLGLFTTEVHQKARDEVVVRQQAELLELSTPVVQLWKGVLALPIIGTLDSRRTQSAMETLLESIVATRSEIAILDITGVPTVDTLTAQHLLKTITATRLMGAECILSGIRPQIAQTIVQLGVDLGDVCTKASLASALEYALQKLGVKVSERGERA